MIIVHLTLFHVSSFHSAYTEPFPVCSVSATVSNEEDHGRTSEEEDGCGDHCHDRQVSYCKYPNVNAQTIVVHTQIKVQRFGVSKIFLERNYALNLYCNKRCYFK